MNSKHGNAVVVVAATLLLFCYAVTDGGYTFPKCAENGKGCCQYGLESMRHHGLVIIKTDESDIVVTCKSGFLRCSKENPEQKANFEIAANVTCPDFAAMMESRSEITYLSGVQTKDDNEDEVGRVQAADI